MAKSTNSDDYRVITIDGERLQQWTCRSCGARCRRPVVRGQRPTWCDDCRRAHVNRGPAYRQREAMKGRGRYWGDMALPHRTRDQVTTHAAAAATAEQLAQDRLTARLFGQLTVFDVAAWKRALRNDPCAYCFGPGGTIDHIVPTLGELDRNDWSNMTGACHRCNAIKHTIPLLTALLWVPTSRRYHDQRRAMGSARS